MTTMTMRQERAGDGSLRHVPTPFIPTAGKAKGKKATKPADPIKANPDTSAQQLAQLIERIERLEEEKAGILGDINEVYAEAKATGFDVKTMRTIVKIRKLEKHHRIEAEEILETYKSALGIV